MTGWLVALALYVVAMPLAWFASEPTIEPAPTWWVLVICIIGWPLIVIAVAIFAAMIVMASVVSRLPGFTPGWRKLP